MGFEDKVDEKKIRKEILARDLLTFDVKKLEKMMEEMAHAPREEMGKREPGETCTYERKQT